MLWRRRVNPLKTILNISALASRDFRLYAAGNAISLQGLWVQRITIAWIAWDLSGQAAFVGLIAFLGFAPTMVTGPIFGVLADRTPLIRAAMATQGALCLLALAMAAFHATGWLDRWSLAFLALAIGVVTSAHHPVRMTLAPLLAPPQAMASIITITSLNFNLARSIGPAIGGALIATVGVGATLWLIAVCYLPYIVLLRWLHPRARVLTATESRSVLGGFAQGLARIRSDPFMRRVLATTGVFALGGRGVLELLPAIADGVFARGAAGLGTLTSAAGIGALAASATIVAMPAIRPGTMPRRGQAAVWAGLALGLVLAVSTSWTLTLAAAVCLGGCGAMVGVSMQSALQLSLEDAYRGRVMSLWVMTGIGCAALGALLIGALADRFGLAWGTVLVYGAGLALFRAFTRRRV